MDISEIFGSLFYGPYEFLLPVFGAVGVLIGVDVILNFVFGAVSSLFSRR